MRSAGEVRVRRDATLTAKIIPVPWVALVIQNTAIIEFEYDYDCKHPEIGPKFHNRFIW